LITIYLQFHTVAKYANLWHTVVIAGDDDGHRSISAGGGANTSSTTRCAVCRIDYTPQLTLQDHIFTSEHIARIKELLRSNGTDDSVPDGSGSGQPPHDEHHHDQRPPRSKTKSRERRRSATSASATNTTTGTITPTTIITTTAICRRVYIVGGRIYQQSIATSSSESVGRIRTI
jgi:hypothetical protein